MEIGFILRGMKSKNKVSDEHTGRGSVFPIGNQLTKLFMGIVLKIGREGSGNIIRKQ